MNALVLLLISFTLMVYRVEAIALTYKMTPYERACFYETITNPKQELSVFFAVPE